MVIDGKSGVSDLFGIFALRESSDVSYELFESKIQRDIIAIELECINTILLELSLNQYFQSAFASSNCETRRSTYLR